MIYLCHERDTIKGNRCVNVFHLTSEHAPSNWTTFHKELYCSTTVKVVPASVMDLANNMFSRTTQPHPQKYMRVRGQPQAPDLYSREQNHRRGGSVGPGTGLDLVEKKEILPLWKIEHLFLGRPVTVLYWSINILTYLVIMTALLVHLLVCAASLLKCSCLDIHPISLNLILKRAVFKRNALFVLHSYHDFTYS